MHIKDYQLAAQRTLPDLGSQENNLLHMDMGILTELGEIVDILKKKFAYGKEVDTVHLGEEIGDTFWYIANRFTLTRIKLIQDLPDMEFERPLPPQEVYRILIEYYQNPTYDLHRLIWSLSGIALSYGLKMGTILETNIAKLKARYPDKFDADKALNRDLDAERLILEYGHSQSQPVDQ
jgi:NTP pyrophosphatase (non-canonical NTP hydrolase)